MFLVVLGLLLFLLLVVLHEYGHFMAARRNGVEVEEFGIGFPPRLYGRKLRGSKTLFSINLLPLGGFVKLKGETDADRRPGSFGAAKFSVKLKILLAGVMMNLLIAYLLLLLLSLIGLPRAFDNQFTVKSDERARSTQIVVAHVVADSAAGSAGMRVGDKLITINGQSFADEAAVLSYTRQRANQPAEIVIDRHGERQVLRARIGRREDGSGLLGIQPMAITTVRYTYSAPLVAAGVTGQAAAETVKSFGAFAKQLLSDGFERASEQPVAGPIGIFMILRALGELGLISYLVFLMALLSASLAALNVLPIPALDGGRLALIAAFRVMRRPLTEKTESLITGLGFMVLIGLIIFITVIDVGRLRD